MEGGSRYSGWHPHAAQVTPQYTATVRHNGRTLTVCCKPNPPGHTEAPPSQAAPGVQKAPVLAPTVAPPPPPTPPDDYDAITVSALSSAEWGPYVVGYGAMLDGQGSNRSSVHQDSVPDTFRALPPYQGREPLRHLLSLIPSISLAPGGFRLREPLGADCPPHMACVELEFLHCRGVSFLPSPADPRIFYPRVLGRGGTKGGKGKSSAAASGRGRGRGGGRGGGRGRGRGRDRGAGAGTPNLPLAARQLWLASEVLHHAWCHFENNDKLFDKEWAIKCARNSLAALYKWMEEQGLAQGVTAEELTPAKVDWAGVKRFNSIYVLFKRAAHRTFFTEAMRMATPEDQDPHLLFVDDHGDHDGAQVWSPHINDPPPSPEVTPGSARFRLNNRRPSRLFESAVDASDASIYNSSTKPAAAPAPAATVGLKRPASKPPAQTRARSKPRQAATQKPTQIACLFCDATDHIARNCPTVGPSRGACYSCGESGHIARNCPSADIDGAGGDSDGGQGVAAAAAPVQQPPPPKAPPASPATAAGRTAAARASTETEVPVVTNTCKIWLKADPLEFPTLPEVLRYASGHGRVLKLCLCQPGAIVEFKNPHAVRQLLATPYIQAFSDGKVLQGSLPLLAAPPSTAMPDGTRSFEYPPVPTTGWSSSEPRVHIDWVHDDMGTSTGASPTSDAIDTSSVADCNRLRPLLGELLHRYGRFSPTSSLKAVGPPALTFKSDIVAMRALLEDSVCFHEAREDGTIDKTSTCLRRRLSTGLRVTLRVLGTPHGWALPDKFPTITGLVSKSNVAFSSSVPCLIPPTQLQYGPVHPVSSQLDQWGVAGHSFLPRGGHLLRSGGLHDGSCWDPSIDWMTMPHYDVTVESHFPLGETLKKVYNEQSACGIYLRLLFSPDLDKAADECLAALHDLYALYRGLVLIPPPPDARRSLPPVKGRYLSIHCGLLQLRSERWTVAPSSRPSLPIKARRTPLPAEFHITDLHMVGLFKHLANETVKLLEAWGPLVSRVKAVRLDRPTLELAPLRLLFASTMVLPDYDLPHVLHFFPALLSLGNGLSHLRHCNRLISTSTVEICTTALKGNSLNLVCCPEWAEARKTAIAASQSDADLVAESDAEADGANASQESKGTDTDMHGDDSVSVDYSSTSEEGEARSNPLPKISSFQANEPTRVRFADKPTVVEFEFNSPIEEGSKEGDTPTELRGVDALGMYLGATRVVREGVPYDNPWLAAHKRVVAPGTMELLQVDRAPSWVLPHLSFYDLQAFRVHLSETPGSVAFVLGAEDDDVQVYLEDALKKADPFLSMLGDRQALHLTLAHPTVEEPLPADGMAPPSPAVTASGGGARSDDDMDM